MKQKSLRAIMAENEKAMEHYAAMTGKPTPAEYLTLTSHNIRENRKRAAPNPSNIPLEHEEQKNFVKWFRMQYPKVRIFAVPNAAARDHNAASYMRAEGLSAGCPDLWIPEFKMCIEMKRIKGSVTSPEQIEWRDYMLGIGWNAHICKGFEEAKRVCLERDRG